VARYTNHRVLVGALVLMVASITAWIAIGSTSS
jgi:hypothetical protein